MPIKKTTCRCDREKHLQILIENWESGSKAYMRAALLPPLWFIILKLQLLLQVRSPCREGTCLPVLAFRCLKTTELSSAIPVLENGHCL